MKPELSPTAVLEAAARGDKLLAKQLGDQLTGMVDEEIRPLGSRFDRLEKRLGEVASVVGGLAGRERARLDRRQRIDPARDIVRAVIAQAWAWHSGKPPAEHAAEMFKEDGPALLLREPASWLTRATTNPAMTTIAGWAAELVPAAAFDAIMTVAPASAYAQLAARGLRLDLAGNASVRMVNRAVTATGSFFTSEGDPLPVRALAFGSATATPTKGGIISLVTGEVLRQGRSTEAVIRQSLQQDAQLEVDTILLGAGAAVPGKQPAGLLNGLTPIAATTGGGQAALAGDLAALGAAIPNAGDLVLITTEADRLRALAWAPGLAAATIIVSTVLPAKTVVALDASDFYSGAGDDFDLSTSVEATVVSRTDPVPVVSAAGVQGVPTLSAFQMDLLTIRLLQSLTWGMALPGRIATISGVTW